MKLELLTDEQRNDAVEEGEIKCVTEEQANNMDKVIEDTMLEAQAKLAINQVVGFLLNECSWSEGGDGFRFDIKHKDWQALKQLTGGQ